MDTIQIPINGFLIVGGRPPDKNRVHSQPYSKNGLHYKHNSCHFDRGMWRLGKKRGHADFATMLRRQMRTRAAIPALHVAMGDSKGGDRGSPPFLVQAKAWLLRSMETRQPSRVF